MNTEDSSRFPHTASADAIRPRDLCRLLSCWRAAAAGAGSRLRRPSTPVGNLLRGGQRPLFPPHTAGSQRGGPSAATSTRSGCPVPIRPSRDNR